MSIEEETAELEKEANDPLLILGNHGETRYILLLRAELLRNGYRLTEKPDDSRVLPIMHVASQRMIYEATANELRYTRPEPHAFVQFLEQTRRGTTQ